MRLGEITQFFFHTKRQGIVMLYLAPNKPYVFEYEKDEQYHPERP